MVNTTSIGVLQVLALAGALSFGVRAFAYTWVCQECQPAGTSCDCICKEIQMEVAYLSNGNGGGDITNSWYFEFQTCLYDGLGGGPASAPVYVYSGSLVHCSDEPFKTGKVWNCLNCGPNCIGCATDQGNTQTFEGSGGQQGTMILQNPFNFFKCKGS